MGGCDEGNTIKKAARCKRQKNDTDSLGSKKVAKVVQVEGSLSGVSLTINMKETVENLRVRNKLVKKNAK